MARIAINGFGRIGRSTFRAGFGKPGFEIVAINDLTDPKTLAHLLQFDTNYGEWGHEVGADKTHLKIGKTKIPVFAKRDPRELPWKKLIVDIVIESTGAFTSEEGASAHLDAGAKQVVISAPAKGGDVPTFVIGANEKLIAKDKHLITNNASCTTNCVAPAVAILDAAFGVKKALMSTIHGYTADQNLVDGPHRDLRRARAAAENLVPTSTGAAIAATEALPQLKNKFDGLSFRIPLSTMSLSDITLVLNKKVTAKQVNDAIKKACKSPRWKGIVAYEERPLVSSDYVGNSHSAIFDLELTRVVDGDLVKVVAWYDNEWGYANRLAEMAIFLAKRFK